MKIKSLTLNGFRNIKKTSLKFGEETSIFALIGENGHGKTNVLEAIFLLAISKSFRTNTNEELISFNEDYCTLKGEVNRGDEDISLDLIVTREPPKKTLKVNGVQKKASEYIGNLNAVFFSPEDIGMIHLSPGIRRKYLDLLLSQLDREYLEDSLKYQMAVKQRNSLLKQIDKGNAKEEELEFWDGQLAELGLRIMKKREDVVGQLNLKVRELYRNISASQDELEIKYMPSIEKAEDKTTYLERLSKSRRKDIINGSTQLGPHRDDLVFLCNGHDMASFASRGEWRSLVLTLKFSEIDLLKEKNGFYPILLLDDVFSELDEERQKYLFNIIGKTQTFLTTTHKEFLDVIEGEKKIYEVREGEVIAN